MTTSPTAHQPVSRLRSRYGSWALVTGASDGLGRELVRLIAADGVNVVLVARREALLHELADELRSRHGVTTQVIAVDLSTEDGVSTVLESTRGLDIGLLVAAAGFGTGGDLIESPLDRELTLLRVNCEAPLIMAHHYGRLMRQRGSGAIVLIGSIVGFQGVVGQANYAATKAYVQSLGEALRVELSPHHVDVVVAAPGPVNTGFGDRAGLDLSSGADPRDVAVATLKRLPRAGTTFPGVRAKLLGYGTLILPRRVRTKVISTAVASMRAG